MQISNAELVELNDLEIEEISGGVFGNASGEPCGTMELGVPPCEER